MEQKRVISKQMKETALKIALLPLWFPMLLVMGIMYVFIKTEEDEIYIKSKIQELESDE